MPSTLCCPPASVDVSSAPHSMTRTYADVCDRRAKGVRSQCKCSLRLVEDSLNPVEEIVGVAAAPAVPPPVRRPVASTASPIGCAIRSSSKSSRLGTPATPLGVESPRDRGVPEPIQERRAGFGWLVGRFDDGGCCPEDLPYAEEGRPLMRDICTCSPSSRKTAEKPRKPVN